MPEIFLFDTSVYIAYIREKKHAELIDRTTEAGRAVLSSVVAMELYAGARSTAEKRLLDQYVSSMKRLKAYDVPGEGDWAKSGILVERYTRLRGHTDVRDHFRDILLILTALHRDAVLVSTNKHLTNWMPLLKRQGETLRMTIV